VLSVDSFELQKQGSEYVVLTDRSKAAGKLSWDENFIKSIAERLWGRASRDPKQPLTYTSSEINQLDRGAQLMRKGSNTAPAAGNLSMPLRVVGDYLDRQKARTFSISWSIYSVTARRDYRRRKKRRKFHIAKLIRPWCANVFPQI